MFESLIKSKLKNIIKEEIKKSSSNYYSIKEIDLLKIINEFTDNEFNTTFDYNDFHFQLIFEDKT